MQSDCSQGTWGFFQLPSFPFLSPSNTHLLSCSPSKKNLFWWFFFEYTLIITDVDKPSTQPLKTLYHAQTSPFQATLEWSPKEVCGSSNRNNLSRIWTNGWCFSFRGFWLMKTGLTYFSNQAHIQQNKIATVLMRMKAFARLCIIDFIRLF